MAQRHTTTCASCFSEIEYGAICNCTDFNEVHDDRLDDEFIMGDEVDDIGGLSEVEYVLLDEYYDRYDY